MPTTDPRRALRVATLLILVVWLPVFLLWEPLLHVVTVDDAFYYFTIGRNIADGSGSTFDGMHPTNGYHPLWMGVTVAVYALGLDGTAAVLTLLVVQLLVWVAALWVLSGVAGSAIGDWPALRGRADAAAASRRATRVVAVLWFLMGANPFILKLFVNGMETGIGSLVGALLLASAWREEGDPLRRPKLAIALLAAAFLARTDAALLVGALGVWTLLVRRRIDRTMVVVAASLAAVVAAYVASNVAIVGHPMQVSGVTKRVDPDLARVLVLGACAAAAGAVLALGLRCRSVEARRFPRLRRWVAATAWWPAGSLLLLAYDWGLSSEVYLWHYAPHALWVIATFALAVADILEGTALEREADDPSGARRSQLVAALMLVPFVAGSVAILGRVLDPELRSMQLGDRRAAEWMSENLPADAVVASGDAGVIGYFTERPVVNLDGLVNSFDWYDARQDMPDATRAFLVEAGVTHVANHGDLIGGDDPSLRAVIDEMLGADGGQSMVLVHREEYVVSGGAGGVSGRRAYATSVFALDPPL